MKSIHRFLIAILLVTGLAGVSFAQRGPGDHGKGTGRHGNPHHLNLSDSCWRVFLSQIPEDSAAMLTRALECLKDVRTQFDSLWHMLREAHAAHDSVEVARLRALLAELRAQRKECGDVAKTIMRQYSNLLRQIRKECGRKPRPDRPDRDDRAGHGIKLGHIVPNPVPAGQTSATLNYGIAADGTVTITINDQLGNMLKEVFTGNLVAGPQTQALDLTGLAPGMYYVRIQTGDAVATARLLIQ